MNKYAKEWIKALRSGKYKQTQEGVLCDLPDEGPASFCCLGVAEDLFNEVIIGTSAHGSFKCKFEGEDEDDNLGIYLTEETRKLLGLRTIEGIPMVAIGVDRESLVVMNDSGSTFKQIANTLEAHEEHYFIK